MEASGLALTAEPIPLQPTNDFQNFYQRHSASVFRAAYRVTGNRADAEDVLQTVFLHILNLTPPLDLASTSDSYLRRSATNASIDLLRKKSTRSESPLDGRPDPKAHTASFLLKETLRRALARLKPEEAELFVLREVEGLTYEELAEQFELERGTVASRLHRIRQSLLKSLQR